MNNYDQLKETVQKIKDSLSIVDVISSYISVKKAGRNYSALCPFHPEDTPSFYVFAETNTYHCFGCGAHGDAINFVKEYEKVSYVQAVKKLAAQSGIQIELEERPEIPELRLNREVAVAYSDTLMNLPDSSEIWKYLKNRSIDRQAAKEFELGFSTGKEVMQVINKSDFKVELAIRNGLYNQNREFFNNRLIIPIRDNNGDLSGFSARSIDGSSPKYLNTPETQYFKKGKILYLYHKTKNYIKQNDFAIIVEGYFDAISMYRAGFKNVAAVLGSVLTKEHAFELMKSTNKIITMFDSDEAGRKATLSSIDNLCAKGFQIAVAKYDEKDPDELVRSNQNKYIAELLKKSYKFHEYIPHAYVSRYDIQNDFGLEEYLKEMSVWYKKFTESKRFEILDTFISTIAQITKKRDEIIEEIIKSKIQTLNFKADSIIQNQQKHQNLEKEIRYDFDRSIIYLWLKYDDYKEKLNELDSGAIDEGPAKEFLRFVNEGKNITQILENGSVQLCEMISQIYLIDSFFEPGKIYDALKMTFERKIFQKHIDSLKNKLKGTVDEEERAKIALEIINCISKQKSLGGK